uniref:BTB domain-containing protein n=1 Tax=Panagrolaimus davidi TaxID=227884 RepID=A0A914QJ93_9BILA
MSDPKVVDVVILSADDVEIPSSRSILAKYSTVFTKIFDEKTELPIKLKIENFNVDTIISAFKFCFGRHVEVIQNITDVIRFFTEYAIFPLTDDCCKKLDESVTIENVCDIVPIAYSNNFESLKQKCLKLLSETKMSISPLKFKELPKNILVDMLYV